MQKQQSIFFGISIFLLTIIFVSMIIVNFGCVPPEPQIDPVRQKAIDDSLKKVAEKKYQFEIMKYWSTGYEYHKSKMYRNALKPFWKVAEIDTLHLQKSVWSKLVDCYFKLNVPDSAEIACEKGLEQYPENLYLLRNIAHIYSTKGQNEKAIERYIKIVELAPKAIGDWKKLGSLYLKEDNTDSAIETYVKALELNPEDKEINEILVKLYGQTGNEDAVVDRLKKSRELEPDNPKHMFSLGKEYFKRELYELAVPEFRSYLKQNPEDNFAAEYLGSSLQNLEKYQEAIDVYTQIINRKPDHKKSLCEMATCLKFQKKFRQARTYTDKAFKVEPNFGLAYIIRGEIYEAATEDCMDKRGKSSPEFDDKLIFKLAYDQYVKAKNDPSYKSLASRKIEYVKQLIPTKEDLFMHKSQKKAKISCYRWIY